MLRTYINKPILAISLELYEDSTNTMRKEVMKNQWFSSTSGLGSKVKGGRVLVVDEVDDSRTTLQYAVETLIRTNSPSSIAVLVVHNKLKLKKGALPKDVVYISGEDVEDHWNAYPWDCEKYGNTIAEHEARAKGCDGAVEQKSMTFGEVARAVLVFSILVGLANFKIVEGMVNFKVPTRRVAVVGSGVGGLVAAGILSRDPGVHVDVLERRDGVGGRCGTYLRTLESHNVTFRTEVGPSLLLLPAVYEETFELCGIQDAKDIGVEIKECVGATYGIFREEEETLYVGGDSEPPEAMNEYMEVSNLMLEAGETSRRI